MKIDVGSILNILVAVYKAFLSGRTFNVGGTQVTLPEQGQAVPQGLLAAPPPVVRPPGFVVGFLSFLFLGLPIIALALAGVWERHAPVGVDVAGQLRAVLLKRPGAVVLALGAWIAVVAVVLGVAVRAWL